jgi:MFS superfamily sulfate permease-like transporter
VVCAVGVEQGIILAIVLSIIEVIRRHYKPKDFVVTVSPTGDESYAKAVPGAQSDPGLIIFRYDSDLFYANANRFVDDVEALIDKAPDPVRWLILDAESVDDIDYSAGVSISGLMDYLKAREVTFALSGADTGLVDTLRAYDLLDRIGADHLHDNLSEALDAFRADSTSP